MTCALDITRSVKPPRAVFVNFPLGHQTGPPDQPELQRRIVADAMRAFEAMTSPATIVELPYVWDANDRSWEDIDYTKGWMPKRPSGEAADALEAQRQARFRRKWNQARRRYRAAGRGTSLNASPTVGFALPWAGVTPAPNVKKGCGTSSLLERVECRGVRVAG